nr:MAG TPA: hypothetical protein [Caudoviricetes sp.]
MRLLFLPIGAYKLSKQHRLFYGGDYWLYPFLYWFLLLW